jgi:hypothetical protein
LASIAERPGHAGIDDVRSRVDLHADLVALVEVEGPIHRDRCAEALRQPWAISRMTARARRAIDESLESLVGEGALVIVADSFVARPHQLTPVVRVALDDDAATIRKVAEIWPAELELAVEHLVDDSRTIAEADLAVGLVKLFGWSRRGPDLTAAVTRAVAALEVAGRIARDDRGRLTPR